MVLICIYTYQFENFTDYWETYFGISLEMQQDIGLELYDSDPRSLLLRLLTPTTFLIVTIIQLHYFHEDFIRLAKRDRAVLSDFTEADSGAIIQIDVTDEDSPQALKPDIASLKGGGKEGPRGEWIAPISGQK